MADKGKEPTVNWQSMLGEMEKNFNAFANQAMATPEFSKILNQFGGAAAGAQRQMGELMEKYLLTMNLPSRAQLVGMSERLQSIETQLNEIKALLNQGGSQESRPNSMPRPPRTKRPPSEGDSK